MPLSFCLLGIPQAQPSLYSSTALQGPSTALANGTSRLSVSSLWYDGVVFAVYSITHDQSAALVMFPHPYKLQLSEGCWEPLPHLHRWKGQSWRHLRVIVKKQLKPQSNLCFSNHCVTKSAAWTRRGSRLLSHTEVSSLLKQTLFISLKEFFLKASTSSLKEISDSSQNDQPKRNLYPLQPPQFSPLPTSLCLSVPSRTSWCNALL